MNCFYLASVLALAGTATARAAAPVPALANDADTFRYLGRVNPETNELSWPGTGVAFAFTGTSATIDLASVTGANSADLIIDGGEPTVIADVTGDSISTPEGLAQGNHTVVLRKRSEAELGSIFIGNVSSDGTLSVGEVPTRQVEIIGDSISVGYGLDGTLPCTNSAALEDNPLTYGALAAEGLGADYSVVAWSGKGLIRNIATGQPDTSPLMTDLYTRYGANDADGSYTFPAVWTPQAVVINLGTNDFSYLDARDPIDPAAFTDGIVQFVESIQTHYPDAEFFLLNSPMLSDSYPTAEDAQKTTQTTSIKDAVEQLGEKAHFVDWPTQGADVGCDYHPNAATHAAEATVLADALSLVLGW